MTDLLTTAEAATILGRSPWTVVRWVKAGKLEAVMQFPSGDYVFTQSAVDARLAVMAAEEPEGGDAA